MQLLSAECKKVVDKMAAILFRKFSQSIFLRALIPFLKSFSAKFKFS